MKWKRLYRSYKQDSFAGKWLKRHKLRRTCR